MTNYVKEQQQANTISAPRIPLLPEKVNIEYIKNEINTLNDIPIGVSKKELEVCKVDYLTNLGILLHQIELLIQKNLLRVYY